VGEDGGAATARPELAEDRPLDLDVVGDVEECPAAEQRGVGGSELVAVGRDLGEEVAADKIGMLAGGLAQGHEDDALAGQLLVHLDLARLRAALSEDARRALDGQRGRAPVGRFEGLEVVELEALEVDPAPLLVGAVGQADLLVDVPRLTPACAQPVGFLVEAGDLLHGLQRETHRSSRPSLPSRAG